MDYKSIRFIGRHILKDNYQYFSYSGSGFEFLVVPKQPSFSITLNLMSETREHEYQYIAIYINNEFYSKEKLVSGLNIKKLVLNSKQTLIKIIKLNEVYLSSIYLKDIVLDNASFGVIKTSNKKIIGFFGDSVTCGFGLVDLHGQEFKMETEDFTKTYAYLASLSLDMDYSVVSRSGISLALPIYIDKTFNEIYDTVDMFLKCKEDRKMNYAVINLGANDNSAYYQLVKDIDKPQALETFKKEYITLVDRIIKDNPQVKIVMFYNMLSLLEEIKEAIKDVYNILNKKYKNDIRLLEGITNSDGACFHPYETAHKENVDLLGKVIKEMNE